MSKKYLSLAFVMMIIFLSLTACSDNTVKTNLSPIVTEALPVLDDADSTTDTSLKEASSKASQNLVIPEEVNQILMKDSQNGWAMKKDGGLIATKDAWNTYEEIYHFDWVKESIPDISYVDKTLFVSGFLTEDSKMGIYRSEDNGDTWSESIIDYSGENGGAYQLFTSFVDNQKGYLYYLGGPALGLMTKILYRTEDGGKTFVKIADISYIDGYPTGMAFNESGEGFITSTYHGNEDSYLYTSNDQGKTWSTVTIQPPEDLSYSYIDGYPPYFIEEDGYLILMYMNEEPTYIMFHSADGGKSWGSYGSMNVGELLLDYSICDENTVYFTDYAGNTYKIIKTNDKWN